MPATVLASPIPTLNHHLTAWARRRLEDAFGPGAVQVSQDDGGHPALAVHRGGRDFLLPTDSLRGLADAGAVEAFRRHVRSHSA